MTVGPHDGVDVANQAPPREAAMRPVPSAPLRNGLLRHRLVRWSVEFGTFGLLAVAYTVVRSLVTADPAQAIAHAEWLASLQGGVVRSLEEALNVWLLGSTVLAVAACYLYAVLHYVATPAVFLLSRRRGGALYWNGYWSLVVASGLAVLVYATFPVAPPRLTPSTGIVDVMREFADYGWWGAAASAPRGIGDATNQYAAVPSMHFGWALWTSIQLWLMGGRLRRTLAVIYPLLMTLVVIGTGNHFLLDVLAGAVCVVIGYGVVVLARRLATDSHAGHRDAWETGRHGRRGRRTRPDPG